MEKKKKGHPILMFFVVLLVMALMMIPMIFLMPELPPWLKIPGMTEPVLEEPKTLEEALTMRPVHTGELNNELRLRSMFESTDTSILLDSGYLDLTRDSFVVTKPLVISPDAHLRNATYLEVAKNGCMIAEGEFYNGDGILKINKGGRVILEDATRLVSNFLWDESGTGLELRGSADLQMNGSEPVTDLEAIDNPRYLRGSLDDLFGDAYHVTKPEELRKIPKDAPAVVIDADLSLKKNSIQKNLLISPGVTVEIDEKAALNLGSCLLVNQGILKGSIQAGNPSRYEDFCQILNFGTLDGRVEFLSRGVLVNFGELYTGIDCGGCEQIINRGTLTVDPDGMTFDGDFLNLGTVQIPAGACLTNATYLNNYGTIEVNGPNSTLLNLSVINSLGTVKAANGGIVRNAGAIFLDGTKHDQNKLIATLDVDDSSRFEDDGFLMYSYFGRVTVPGGAETLKHVIPFAWRDQPDGITPVTTQKEFEKALRDESCPWVSVETDIGAFTADLVVSKGIVAGGGVPIRMAKGADLILDGGDACLIYCPVILDGGDLILRNGAKLFAPTVTGAENIVLESGSTAFIQGEWNDTYSWNLTVKDGSILRFGNALQFDGASISVGKGCQFSTAEECTMNGTQFTIEKGGAADFFRLILNKGSAIQNSGDLRLLDWAQFSGGTVENNGTIRCDAQLQGKGKIVNNGDFFAEKKSIRKFSSITGAKPQSPSA